MNLKPLGNRVIVKQDAAETATAGGLFLTHDSVDAMPRGTVLSVGDGMIFKDGVSVPMPVEVGDKVIYGKHSGSVVTLDGEDVIILRVDDLYAVVR